MKRLLAAAFGAALVFSVAYCSDNTDDSTDSGTPTTKPENSDALCSDGKDNDNNGATDCKDARCCVGGAPGQGITVCAVGTCYGPGNPDPGTNPGTDGGSNKENTNATCGDGVDNDGNNHKDCDDWSCCKDGTPAPGVTVCEQGTCYGPGKEPNGDGGSSGPDENTDALCEDGIDNDGNGHKDCADYSCCRNGTPGAGITVCAEGTCAGPGNEGNDGGSTGPDENTDALCSDGQDNDGNGHKDCADYSCCRNGTPADGITVCAQGTCEPTNVEQETGDTQCQDGQDNDSDTFVDCKDNSCCRDGVPADGVSVCAAGSCEGPGNTNVEYGDAECGNGQDDDGDTFVDCADFSCCKSGTPAPGVTVCATGSCEGPGNPNVEYGDAECSDGQDNDGDTYTDCRDFSCCKNGTPAPGVTVCAQGTCAQQ